MFIEGSTETTDEDSPDADGDSSVKSLRLRGVCESVLEARLQRLIRRQKFDEAINFAKLFRLSVETVYQAKANNLLEQLSPWKTEKLSDKEEENLIVELKECLKKLNDLDFMVQCCITAALPKLDQIRSLLTLGRETIRNNADKSLSVDLMVNVSLTLQKLETFNLARPQGTIDEWIEFSRSRPLDECLEFLKGGNLNAVLIMWSRHKPDISVDLDSDVILEMLDSISPKWSVEEKLTWLGEFLPDCLMFVPESLAVISSWTSKAAREYELTDRKNWPSNGLEFAEGALQTLSFPYSLHEVNSLKASRAQFILNQQRTDPDSELARLIELIDNLKDLKILHKTYRLRVKLADFVAEDKTEVVRLILDWCAEAEELTEVINGFLSDFIHRKELQMGDVFAG